MKRFLILFMVLGLVVGAVATAEAKRKKQRVERTVEGTYNTQFVPYSGMVVPRSCAQEDAVGCVLIGTLMKEAFFTAKATDAHGQPVLVTVRGNYPLGGPETESEYGTFCGETAEPIPFDPGVELRFSPGYWDPYLPTPWASCAPGFGTTGTISVTLSNLP